MKRNLFSKTTMFAAIFIVLSLLLALPSSADKKKVPDNTRIRDTTVNETTTAGSTLFDRGIDLVVSKVKLTRGVFAGQDKIQIIVFVKNMCNDTTSKRIKVWLPDIMAIWIEGGIGPKQEKRTAAYYVTYNPDHPTDFMFDVHVDNNNTIKENNETNNVCRGVLLGASQRTVTHICPPVGPHCKEPPNIKKYQMKEDLTRR
jgi:hypothetical protein